MSVRQLIAEGLELLERRDRIGGKTVDLVPFATKKDKVSMERKAAHQDPKYREVAFLAVNHPNSKVRRRAHKEAAELADTLGLRKAATWHLRQAQKRK